jgi:hypothetical protein
MMENVVLCLVFSFVNGFNVNGEGDVEQLTETSAVSLDRVD